MPLTRRAFVLGALALGNSRCAPTVRNTTSPPTVVVDQPSAPVDLPVAIELLNFAPRQPVSVTATLTYQHGGQFRSHAVFVTDKRGQVAIARQAPPQEPTTLGGGGGGINEAWAAILASHGCAALALAYFGVPGRPRGLVNIPLEYFETAIEWMRVQPWLRGEDTPAHRRTICRTPGVSRSKTISFF